MSVTDDLLNARHEQVANDRRRRTARKKAAAQEAARLLRPVAHGEDRKSVV